ncbi:hypothetical protein Pth03_68270 [Planotetraspora thailandica]|uniref:Lipoprotein n=1 Tax=Planotetraspora thailandica TaxID=487172 RepID=A0A8J4DDA6_9ACTN|nr:hypothetical protein Pth03_68270 [Planotetraspora thailandica]
MAAAFTVAALATACSSGDDAKSAAPGPTGAATTAAPASSQAAPSTDDPSVPVVGGPVGTSSSSIGLIVVDSTGRTVYAYDKDTTDPVASTCTGECAATWQPVPATTDVSGIDAGLVGSLPRADGSQQLTIAHHPVYVYSGDKAAGEVKGQLVKGLWHALSPNGKEITKKA